MTPRPLRFVLLVAATGLVLGTCATRAGSLVERSAATAASEPPPPSTPHPFDRLTCAPEYGVRFCQGNGTTERVPSFDGVPLDADVTLPATGTGPFPLVVMLPGFGDTKTEYEATSDNGSIDNVTFASRGWAVLTYTPRGFGDSCGTAASRQDTPACAKGWIHLADQRYEVRDTQYLAGLLVDEGLVKPKIAVTGVSYGGGQSLELAMLKNRIRLEDGELVSWVSPKYHVPMEVGAVYAEWGWDDLASALVPNGHLLVDAAYSGARDDISPVGVEKESWDSLLYDVAASNYLAPKGTDPGADLTGWFDTISRGEPYGAAASAVLGQLEKYHSAIGIPMPKGGPPPTVMQNGWTDTLFPVSEALHYAERYRADHVHQPLLQIFDDVGHGWSQDKAADVTRQTTLAEDFLDDVMLKDSTPPTGVVAIGTTCPSSAPSAPTLRASSWESLLASSRVHSTSGRTTKTVTASGGSAQVAAELNPAYGSKLCDRLTAAREAGTASYRVLTAKHSPVTILGPLTITARLTVHGRYPELVGLLFDLDPSTHTRQLVEAGVYRPGVNEAASTKAGAVARTAASFQLSADLWTLPTGHELELELVASTSPWFRKSSGRFSISVSHLVAEIATR